MPKVPKPINDTTFEVELLGKDKVEIGDKGSTDFKPHIKLNRWDGECFIKVGLPTTEKPVPIVEGGKVKFKGKDFEAHFYPLDPKTVITKDKDGRDHQHTQNELGGFEFEIILKKKPTSNNISFQVDTENLNWYYQAELNPDDPDYEGSFQPENVIGSFAIYHSRRKHHYGSKAEADKYRCGKAFHLYRAKATDALGNWIWGDWELNDSTLILTISKQWLNKARYPVVIDPNFGYETIGGASYGAMADKIRATRDTPGGAGNADSITVYLNAWASGEEVKCGLYEGLTTYVDQTEERTTGGTANWYQFDFASPPAITAQEYSIAVFPDDDVDVYYDATGNMGYANATYPTWAASLTHFANRWYSIYCTYTAGATPGYKDIATRFKLTVQAFKDIPTRFKLWVQGYQDVATRFKLTVRNYKDIATRFILQVQGYQDIATRFRLNLGYYKDIATRFKLWVQGYQDIATRFILVTGTPAWKDIATRFRLIVQAYQDINTRFWLSVQGYQDIATRFRLTVQGYQDTAIRFILKLASYRDIATRFKLTVQSYQDVATRFRLNLGYYSDIATRFVLEVQNYQDIATRFKLVILTFKDIATRFILVIPYYKDIATRFYLMVPPYYQDVSTRFFLYVPTWKELQIQAELADLEAEIADAGIGEYRL